MANTNLIAFRNCSMGKAELIQRLEAHYAADEITKGTYWQHGKGCAVGCSIHGSEYSDYERMLGIPRILAHLEDSIFEGLPSVEAKEFPLQFAHAIPAVVGRVST